MLNIMKYKINVLFVLLMCSAASAQINDGKIPFKWINSPSPQFAFDLDSKEIIEVMDNPSADISSLFSSIDNLYLRSYHRQVLNYLQMLMYYNDMLIERGWSPDSRNGKLHLYTLNQNNFVIGIFLIVKSGEEVYLINITGTIPPSKVGDILSNLNQIGIDMAELENLSQLPDSTVAPPKTDTFKKEKNSTLDELIDPPILAWQYNGLPIDDFIIQNTHRNEETKIFKFLEKGSGDLENVLPMIIKSLSPHRTVSVKITEENGENIAIFTIKNRKRSKSVSVLRSITINRSGTHRRKLSATSNLEIDELFPQGATRFKAANAPIHEIRIVGNQKISETDIRRHLNNASDNIEQALKTLFKVMPYFSEIKLRVNEENYSRVATISFAEKPLSSDLYLGFRPPLFIGFNRVNDWEFGTGFQIGKPTQLGPLWQWNVHDLLDTRTYNIFGRISTTLGNPKLHYRFGGRINWGEPYHWKIGLTGQVHRQTDVVAPELFPNYKQGSFTFQHVLGYPGLANYYLRNGFEVQLEWSPRLPEHTFNLSMIAESHESLQKSTDWNMAQWVSKHIEARENPQITRGRIHSFTLNYNFNTRQEYLGWYNSVRVELSNAAFGSDFDFARLQIHLRYAFPLENNRIRTRLLFGLSDSPLPEQRQFAIGGLGGLRGYLMYGPADETSTSPPDSSAKYAFMGDSGFLLNVEYHYRLLNLINRNFFKNLFIVLFLDEGQVWNVSDASFSFDPKADVGIGIQYHEASIFRFNFAKTLDSWRAYQTSFEWSFSF